MRETVTVTFGESNSAVKDTWECDNFDRKQVADKACRVFTFDNMLHSLIIKFRLIAVDTWMYRTSATVTQYTALGNIWNDETR